MAGIEFLGTGGTSWAHNFGNVLLKMDAGHPVTGGADFRGAAAIAFSGMFPHSSDSGHAQFGQFASGNNVGYFGFRVVVSSHPYVGWLRLQVDFSDGAPTAINLIPKDGTGIYGAWALDSINAGQIAASAVPEPAQVATGLGLLALGAAGVREFRRRRKLAA